MKLWSAITSAMAGWRLILQRDPAWRQHFNLTSAGFATALAIFAFVAFLAVAVSASSIGMPSLIGVLAAMIVLALPLLALELSLLGTRMLLRAQGPIRPMLVPAVYALTAFLVLEGLVAMIGGPIVMLSWLGLAYLLFRLARVVEGWNLGVAIGFGVLTVLLLVVMRVALYMLTNPAGSPI